jgi:hypothetical protein
MDTWSRRRFLVESGIVLGAAVVAPRIFAEASADSGAAQPIMRGIMVDAARVPGRMEYYRRVVDFCADWELNTLHFRLADDQGSVLRFHAVPDLVIHKNAFTPEELNALAEYAKTRGVDLLPELESFGHTGFITRAPAYAHLLDQSAAGDGEFTGVIPVSPETLELFEKLYREVAAIFPSQYLHGGCDEVNWGGSALSRRALEAKSRAQIWAEYLNSLNKVAVGLKKDFIVWGDMVARKEPEILAGLDKNIILMDWNYRESSSAKVQETFFRVRANGSRAIGAPGLIQYQWGARAGTEQLRNIDAFTECYLGTNDPASLGVVLTNWIPSRYIQNSIWDGFAYAAVAFNEGTATAQTSGFAQYVEKHYGAQWNETWDEAFHLIYDYAPHVKERGTASWMGMELIVPWSSDEELKKVLADKSQQANPFPRVSSLLDQLEASVSKNIADFRAFKLCVAYLDGLYWREAIVTKQPKDREAARTLIEEIAKRDRALDVALSADWDEGRPVDSPDKTEPLFGFGAKDQMLYSWKQATAYSASLAGDPSRFYQLLTTH